MGISKSGKLKQEEQMSDSAFKIVKNENASSEAYSEENIWSSDLKNYHEEIVDYGKSLILLSGLVAVIANPLSQHIFESSVATVQGVAFFIFVVGLIVMLMPVLQKK